MTAIGFLTNECYEHEKSLTGYPLSDDSKKTVLYLYRRYLVHLKKDRIKEFL